MWYNCKCKRKINSNLSRRNIVMEFSKKIQELRNKNKLTQEQFAEKLYVSRTAVSK